MRSNIQTGLEAANKKVNDAQISRDAAQKALNAARKEVTDAVKQLRGNDPDHMVDVPSGEITAVSLPTKTVWINRGHGDSLQQGIRFTVFAGESNNGALAVKKGVVEVNRIVADHQAECRIIDDKLHDPILSGDKVFTPFWSPGQQNHFALAGVMDLDGDKRNQIGVVVGLIRDYGGVVDCWLDEQGHRQGQITTSTQYLIEGDPTDKASPEVKNNNAAIERDADHYQLRRWTLAEFKQKMNYQKTSSVEHFGVGASTSDAEHAASAAKASRAKAAATKAEDEFK